MKALPYTWLLSHSAANFLHPVNPAFLIGFIGKAKLTPLEPEAGVAAAPSAFPAFALL
jgi:hypothetical protein